MTVFRVLFFVVILWEGFVTRRQVMFSHIRSVHLEWCRPRVPVAFHTYSQAPKVFY